MSEFNNEPVQKWKRMNFDEEKLKTLDPRRRAELETNRDLVKQVEQLLCDVHEETHNDRRTPLENIASAQKRMVSLLARVAISNERTTKTIIGLTWAITAMTLAIAAMTIKLISM